MASLVEFPPTAPGFLLQTAAQEESDETRSGPLRKRYEALMRLSKCLTSARPEDLVTSVAAELRPVVDFDLLDIVVNRATTGDIGSGSDCDGQREDSSSSTSGTRCFGEEVKSQCSIPLISRGSKVGALVVGRLDENDFSNDDVEFLTQVACQAAIVLDNSWAHRQIAHLTEKFTPENVDVDVEIPIGTNFEDIVGRSAALRSLLRQVETVAPTDSTVLIYGETGTGKELIARALHNLSARQAGPFVKLNCAAIPTGLLESELFGHERGAFTGAIGQCIGRFEVANHGTAFLDEIGEIPLEVQPKLLRVLQEREFERLGSTRTLRTDARLIAATNRSLAAMVEEQRFRSDLFYRLNVFPVRVPSLRERHEDIPLLVWHFARQFAERMKRHYESISPDTMKALCEYNWPGNIRELQNLIERAVILCPGPVLRVPVRDLHHRTITVPHSGHSGQHQTLEQAERAHILRTLKEVKWVVGGPNGAAARLGMHRSTLQFRMKKLGIVRFRCEDNAGLPSPSRVPLDLPSLAS